MISNKAATEKALLRPIAYLFGATLKPWVRTLDARVADYSQDTDPATIGYGGPAIFLLWHEYILLPVAERRNLGITLLIGPHRDADWLDWIARDFGFNTVRGSSTKGGIKAILQFRKEHPSTSLVVTPDGPKGPRRVLSPGCVQLSGLLQMPVIPVGIGFHRPIRAKTWDNFAIPRPGSRARVVLGDRIQIPRGLNETQLEAHRLWIEEILHRLTLEAESWAEDGLPRSRERALYPKLGAPIHPRDSLGIIDATAPINPIRVDTPENKA